jgi:hypothetical protein
VARSRRGSFGLQPRVAPNVSAQIIALAREYVAKRDSLIMDAWKNGGTFEGKKVTDEMALAYWKDREKGLDKGDPDYESSNNQIMQLEYGIAQSKADVLHLQGKMSDTAYAGFFLKWANKVPKNSEFYRTLQKDAAQLIEGAKAKGRAAADKAKSDAFNAFVTSTTDKDIAIGDAMTKALSDLSKTTGMSVTGNGDELLAKLTTDVAQFPDKYKALLDTIHKSDPHWDGQLTEGYFNQHISAATQGYSLIADRAQKAGYVSAYANATQGMSAMAGWAQNTKVWPVAQSYTTFETAWMKVMQDPAASDMDKTNASNMYAQQLQTLSGTPGIDAGSKAMIDADALRLLGQPGGDAPSFGTTMLGRPGVDPQTSMVLSGLQQKAADMAANPAAFAYTTVDANGNYDPTGQGHLGIVPAGAIGQGAQAVMVPGSDGKAVMAMVPSHAVYVSDPNDPNGSPRLAGYNITYNVGGKPTTLWSYQDNHGQNQWSVTSPLAEGATTQVDNKGDTYVTPAAATAVDVGSQIANLKDSQGNAITLTDEQKNALIAGGTINTKTSTVEKGKAGVESSITVSVKNGWLQSSTVNSQVDDKGHVTSSVTTPIQLAGSTPSAEAFSNSRLQAGDIPGTTFSSPLSASVTASAATQTADQVSKFAADPNFQQQFLAQTMHVLGITNPYDQRIADAWKTATSVKDNSLDSAVRASNMNPAMRADLQYPGMAQVPEATQGKVQVNFGGQNITIPGLPSYLQGQPGMTGAIGQGGSAAGWATNAPWAGLVGAMQPPTQPNPVITPQNPTGVAPTATPAPSNLPGPTPAPTPAPTAYVDPFPGKTADDSFAYNHGK